MIESARRVAPMNDDTGDLRRTSFAGVGFLLFFQLSFIGESIREAA
jgi:hypothetical protein